MRQFRSFPLTLAVLLAFGVAALAEDMAPEVKEACDKVEELLKSNDEAGLKAALKKAAEIHNGTEDAAARSALQEAIAKVLKNKKAGDARIAAAEALGTLNDHKGAWKHLRSAMPDPKTEAEEPIDQAVLKAAGDVADESAIDMLIDLAGKAKDKAIARDAATALGGFTGAGKKRIGILEGLMSIAVRSKPSAGSKGVNADVQARWGELMPAIAKTFNKLTGKNVGTWDEWEVLFKDNKKNLQKLFNDSGSGS